MRVTVRGATFVRAGREAVWDALHDAEVIARCVPGCRSLARASDTTFVLSSRIGIGRLHLVIDGAIEVRDSRPPHSYRLVGRGSGGAITASGSLRIDLREQRGGCRLCYVVEADAGGSLAGAAMAAGIGRGITTAFASRFKQAVAAR